MPSDVFYGADCEVRIGIMADKDTDPTAWATVEFVSATFQKQRDRKERPLIGAPRHNALDPIKPIDGFLSLSADIVIDADSRHTPLWLRHLLGAATTSGPSSGLYTHIFSSGSKTARLCCLQIRTGASEVRIYRGLTLDTLSFQSGGDQVQDFDVQLSVVGISTERAADWLSGTVAGVPASAPVNRAVFRVDGAAASNTLSSSWSYSRGIIRDTFLSTTATISGLRPGNSGLSGQAQFRAVGAVFDQLEEDGTEFAADIQGLGTVASHEVRFAHPQAKLNAPPLAISGPGIIERTFTWFAYQSSTVPGAKVTVVNDVATYA